MREGILGLEQVSLLLSGGLLSASCYDRWIVGGTLESPFGDLVSWFDFFRPSRRPMAMPEASKVNRCALRTA